MNEFLKQANLIKDEIINYRRTIHKNPEVGAELPKNKGICNGTIKKKWGTSLRKYVKVV